MRNPSYHFPIIVVFAVIISAGLVTYFSSNQGLAIGGTINSGGETGFGTNSGESFFSPNYVNAPGVKQHAEIEITPEDFRDHDEVELTFPFSQPLTIRLTREHVDFANENSGDFTWVGKVEGDDTSKVILVGRGSRVAATIESLVLNSANENILYYILPLSPGKGMVLQVDAASVPPLLAHETLMREEIPAIVLPVTVPERKRSDADKANDSVSDTVASETPPGATDATATDASAADAKGKEKTILFSENNSTIQFQGAPTIIDVLAVYTSKAMLEYGPTAANIETYIALRVAVVNDALLNSETNTQLRLVGAYKTNTVESQLANAAQPLLNDIYRIQNPSDGYFDDVIAKRNLFGADVVSLFVANDDYVCELGYNPNPSAPAATAAEYGYTATNIKGNSQACTFAQRVYDNSIGHVLGMQHDAFHVQNGTFPFARGFHNAECRFRTIMAFHDQAQLGCFYPPMLGQYSNPDLFYDEIYQTGSALANNAGALTEIVNNQPFAQQIAGYRAAVSSPVPATPTAVSATNGLYYGKTVVTWNAAAGATVYDVYRVTYNYATGTKIGSTNQTTYNDLSGAPDTLYYYSVRARNTNGESYFSNEDLGFSTTVNSLPAGLENVHQTNATTTSLSLAWDAAGHPLVTRYDIFNDDYCGSQNLLQSVNVPQTSATIPNLTPGQSYEISLRAVNQNGAGPCQDYTMFTTPLPPTSVSATQGPIPVKVTWDSGPWYVTSRIYRSTSPNVLVNPATLINTQSGSGIQFYNDTSAGGSGVAYYYRVTSSSDGTTLTESAPSTEVMGHVGAAPITPPLNLQLTNITNTSAVASWTPTYPTATGYQVFLGNTSTPCETLHTILGPVSNTTLTNLLPAKTYYFSLKTKSGQGMNTEYGPCSLPVKVFTALPSPVTNIFTTPTANSIKITWTPFTLGSVFQYKHSVYRSETEGFTISPANRIFYGPSINLVMSNGTLTYNDTTALPGTKYFYHATTTRIPPENPIPVESAPGPEASGGYS